MSDNTIKIEVNGVELEARPGLRQHATVDAVGDGGHQHVGRLHSLDELG